MTIDGAGRKTGPTIAREGATSPASPAAPPTSPSASPPPPSSNSPRSASPPGERAPDDAARFEPATAARLVQSGEGRPTTTKRGGVRGAIAGFFASMGTTSRRVLQVTVASAALMFAQSAYAPVSADSVFLDHNNAPKEVKMAQLLSREVGEKFIYVLPTKEALDSVFARAERGEIDMSHIILSGHSVGQRVWGTGADGVRRETTIEEMRELATKYPKAAAQVKVIHALACYIGTGGHSAAWWAIFPNVRAIIGIDGSAPSSERPAGPMMLAETTRIAREMPAKKMTPAAAMAMAKRMSQGPGARVVKFAARVDGVHYSLLHQATPTDRLKDRVDVLRAQAFRPYFTAHGEAPQFARPPENHQQSVLRDYYNALQAYYSALDPASYDARQILEEVNQTIRLIYFDEVLTQFQANHGALLKDAKGEARGLQLSVDLPDDVSLMSRADVARIGLDLQKLGQIRFHTFKQTYAPDLLLVDGFLSTMGKEPVAVPTVDANDWQPGSVADEMMRWVNGEYLGDEDKAKWEANKPTDEVKAAAERVAKALRGENPTSLEKLRDVWLKGLIKLSPDVIPSTWIG